MAAIKKLTILHSNDLHGDFLAEEIDEQLIGGVSMLSGYVSKVRREEKNAIYCIAGDMFTFAKQRNRLISRIESHIDNLRALSNKHPLLRVNTIAQLRLRERSKYLHPRLIQRCDFYNGHKF